MPIYLYLIEVWLAKFCSEILSLSKVIEKKPLEGEGGLTCKVNYLINMVTKNGRHSCKQMDSIESLNQTRIMATSEFDSVFYRSPIGIRLWNLPALKPKIFDD